MRSLIIQVVICMVIPLLLLCGMLEKRSRIVVLSAAGGCCACLLASTLNTFAWTWSGCSYYYLTTSIAPFNEECLKFIPILLLSQFVIRDKKLLLAVSFAAGIGFSVVENAYMLAQSTSTSTVAWMFVRGIGSGLMHAMSTTIVGEGILLASNDRRMLLTGTLATLFFAMMYHGAYNAMIITDGIKFFAIFIPLLSYGMVLFTLNRESILRYLEEDEPVKVSSQKAKQQGESEGPDNTEQL